MQATTNRSRLLYSCLFFTFFFAFCLQIKAQELQEISGYVTDMGVPLKGVKVAIKNSENIVATNEMGFYAIKAAPMQTLVFSYIGMQSTEIIIEDVTTTLNIKMKPKVTDLDAIALKGKSRDEELWSEDLGPDGKPKRIPTAFGTIRTAGGATTYIDESMLGPGAIDLAYALNGKVPGASLKNGNLYLRAGASSFTEIPVIWDVDGIIYDEVPPLSVTEVKDMVVLRSLSLTNRYAGKGKGGVVVVRTKAAYEAARQKRAMEIYNKKHEYKSDAIAYRDIAIPDKDYLTLIKEATTNEDALSLYQGFEESRDNDPQFYVDVAQYFYKNVDKHFADEVLQDMLKKFEENPEALKTLAYTYDDLNFSSKALEVYKKIFRLRPKYAQSYRDLAQAFAQDEIYDKAWLMYMGYINKTDSLTGEGIDAVAYREMEHLFINHNEEIEANSKFQVMGDPDNLGYDIRIVFEWNTSEAEFDIEFINPDNQTFAFNHTMSENNERMKEEKLKGYSTEEFLIGDLGDGQWLINAEYYGNKKPSPTYLKVTTYYNWQSPDQRKKVDVFKLEQEDVKMQLAQLNQYQLRAAAQQSN